MRTVLRKCGLFGGERSPGAVMLSVGRRSTRDDVEHGRKRP